MKSLANHSDLLKLDLQFFSEELPPEPIEPSDPIEPPTDPIEPVEPIDPSPPEDDDFFEVKYNKENVRIKRDEAPSYIQKGLNYDKVQQRATEYEQRLQEIASLTGYQSVEDLFQATAKVKRQEEIARQAQEFGVEKEFYEEKLQPFNQKLSSLEQELQTYKQREIASQVEREVNDLRTKYEDFSQYEPQIFELAIQNGYKLEDAYKLVSYEDRFNNLGKQKEQEVLARVTGRGEKQVLAGNGQPSNINFDPSNMSLKEIEELSTRVQRGERITF
ncbi:hypothetical protein [Peribacillus acanthi]|uniref:hypothetical protein n=1 Tax=Peribacillus acanthi TaxID=2171554 RepID=UPI001300A0DC|nr:hypothetical protein [Peribacillus acanthi]